MKRKVRTTFQPDVEIEVEGPEYLDLLLQGVIRPAPAGADSDQPRPPAKSADPTTPDAVPAAPSTAPTPESVSRPAAARRSRS